jgi:chromosome segregation ATPase
VCCSVSKPRYEWDSESAREAALRSAEVRRRQARVRLLRKLDPELDEAFRALAAREYELKRQLDAALRGLEYLEQEAEALREEADWQAKRAEARRNRKRVKAERSDPVDVLVQRLRSGL